MFIDARSLPSGEDIDVDVCIIGAGAAGITIARELSAQDIKVGLIESGDFEIEEKTQELYSGENIGVSYEYPEKNRLRYFGGTTNHWGGWSRPFDPIDFESRPSIPYSGWPFDRTHLDPYYEAAKRVIGIDEPNFDAGYWGAQLDSPLFPFDSRLLSTRLYTRHPTRFGTRFRDDIRAPQNLICYLNANVLELETNEEGGYLVRARIATLTGVRFSVSARYFVLATGGMENARLLLLSNRVHKSGIGNGSDLVGRFFMDPFAATLGRVVVKPEGAKHLPLFDLYRKDDFSVQAAFCLSDDVLRREGLPSCQAFLQRGRSAAILTLEEIETYIGERRWPPRLGDKISRVFFEIDTVTAHIMATYFGAARSETYYVSIGTAQVPNPDSRVMLSEEKDAFGLNRVKLDWRPSEQDKSGWKRILSLLATEFGRTDLGRVQIDFDDKEGEWPELDTKGHHIGTTRMQDDPKQGVVDHSCAVHGVPNLFVAGSSVFPTAGGATPTFTIVALALRLADHLKERFAQ